MKWNFSQLSKGFDYQGIRDGDIEQFDKTRYQSVIRESIQNSLDARLDPNKPVRVEFKFFNLLKTSHPSILEIENSLRACLNWERANEDDKELINQMLQQTYGSLHPSLEISDFNTKGMKANTTFDAFSRSRNVSDKSSAGSAGSKGMGKAAFFALSYLRSIIVSSIYFEDKEELFQGIARLATHPLEDKLYNYKGFYSHDFLPVDSFKNVPTEFRRNEPGTSIFILGLWPEENRLEIMKKELVNNFWLAIYEGDLEVIIQGELINSENIYNLVKLLYKNIDESGHFNTQPNPRPYMEAYLKINCIQKVYSEKIDYLGNVKFIISKNNRYQGRIANFRKSKMLIWKDGARLYKGYCGIFICDDDQGNEYLKKLENATHTEWNANNWKDSLAREVMKSYRDFLIKCINDYFKDSYSNEISIEAFNDLLSLMGDKKAGAEGKANIEATEKKRPIVSKRKEDGESKYIPKSFNWIRNRTIKTDDGYLYYIKMNSKQENNRISFEVLVGNDDSSSRGKVNIRNLNRGKFVENRMSLQLNKGDNEIVLELNDYLKHSIRLKEIVEI